MRLTVTCGECGSRMPLERQIHEPQRVYVVCVVCETPLRCDVTEVRRNPVKDPWAALSR